MAAVAEFVGGRVVGDASTTLTGVAGIKEASSGDLTFVANPIYEKFISETAASAVVVSPDTAARLDCDGVALLVADDPYGAFAKAMAIFAPEGDVVEEGVHPTAVVAGSAVLGRDVRVGANAVIMDEVSLGDGCTIHAGSYIGRRVTLGRDSVIFANVTVRNDCVLGERVVVHSGTVIGSDGFGFARSDNCHRKVPQIGNVVIENDVEIGANVCIDRATLGSTRICRGSKIDNLVQIAHNVVVGEDSLVVAQVGISGSTRVGKRVVLAGQAGLVGHIEIGDGAMVAAQAGVTKSIPAGELVSGYPARRHSTAKRLYAFLENLPRLFGRVRALERRVDRLDGGEAGEVADKED